MIYALSIIGLLLCILACIGACVCIGLVREWMRPSAPDNVEFVRSLNDDLKRRRHTAWERKQSLRAITRGKA